MSTALRLPCTRCLSLISKKILPMEIFQLRRPSWKQPLSCLPSPNVIPVVAYSRSKVVRPYIVYDEESARDFIYSLQPAEREIITREMQKFEEERRKREGQLPEDEPSAALLRFIALHNALPFIGFGFLDNFLMIVAGEYIDAHLGAVLGISTMAAAGFGNLISDVAGIGSASYVEIMAAKVGVRAPTLTPHQADAKSTRRAANYGRALGVAFGCFLGMLPLLFFRDKEEGEKEGENKKGKST